MLAYYVIGGLAIVSLFCFINKIKWFAVPLIPAAFVGYYAFVNQAQSEFGYPIDWNITQSQEATFLYGTEGAEYIYMTVLEKDMRVPRLVKVENSKENRSNLQKLIKRQQEGKVSSIGISDGDMSDHSIGDFSIKDGHAGGQEETK